MFTICFQLLLFLFPLTFGLSSSCYHRYNQLQSSLNICESRWNRFCRIFTVYIIFGYTFLFVLCWSFVTTTSYKLAWIISPFGLTLALFSLFLYIKTKRLKIEDFKFSRITSININDSFTENEHEINVSDQEPIVSGRNIGDKDN